MPFSRRTRHARRATSAETSSDAPSAGIPVPESPLPQSTDYEKSPLSRSEYIAAIVHLYRGEVYRATVQRTRLDMTTNWAVLTTAGLLAFSFRQGDNPHWALLLGMLLISMFMVFEARRYQMFDVWRSRVRKIEENFYGPILRRNPVSPHREWGERVAVDLLTPSYKISFLGALRLRLMRNYWAIFAVLLLSWLLKVLIYPGGLEGVEKESWEHIQANLQFGMVAWWIPLVFVSTFVLAVLAVILFVPASTPADDPNEEFWVESPEQSDVGPIDL